MATLGKVLAVLNVLAAIGFLYVAGMDYNKRQSWAFSHYMHQLAVNGLPLDKDDDTGRLPGRTISAQFGKDASKQLFSTGNAPMTLVDAVNGTVGTFKAGVDSAADINAKRNIIAAHLLPELTQADERDEIIQKLQMVRDQAGVAELESKLEAIATRTARGDRETRRRAIGDFIYNFDDTLEWHKYAQSVLGLDEYVAAAERQDRRLQDMVARDRRVMFERQEAFRAQYQAIPPELNVLADRLQSLDAKLSEQNDLVQKHTALRNARKAEVTALESQLSEEKQRSANEFAALESIQRELFSVQQDWFRAQEKNQQLERDLRTKETEK